jgi:GTPase SAR1 family protein
VQKWIDDVKYQRGEGVIIALLGNKMDLEERDVPELEGKELADRNLIIFKEVSAKTGGNIQEFFKEIAAQLPEVNEPTSRSKAADVPASTSTNKEEPIKAQQENLVLTKS